MRYRRRLKGSGGDGQSEIRRVPWYAEVLRPPKQTEEEEVHFFPSGGAKASEADRGGGGKQIEEEEGVDLLITVLHASDHGQSHPQNNGFFGDGCSLG